MTVQHGPNFGIGLVNRHMQGCVQGSALADMAIILAFHQLAAGQGIGAATGRGDPDRVSLPDRRIAAVRIIEPILTQPVVMAHEIVFEIHKGERNLAWIQLLEARTGAYMKCSVAARRGSQARYYK